MNRADSNTIRTRSEEAGLSVADAMLRALRESFADEGPVPTVLAICPNSEAVVKASMLAALSR